MRGLAPLAGLSLALIAAACAPVRPLEPAPAEQSAPRVDLLRARKAARTLEVWSAGRLVRTIRGIQLGWQPIGPKRFEGDGKTPEGRYVVDWRNPRSAYHLSLHISYPDSRDVAFARARGSSPGGMIMIHGQPNGVSGRVPGDWTDGCIALSDAEIELLWDIVPDGTAIEVTP
ncbi:L,D-transpeptidase family protein [Novosphingobium sp. RD2P27]|uniref:L,D-transpeptidase family protein n=1 Tax=Novosphingobium kalidii TaxID=3230299 RepID=A0ABV2D5N4_9SPHN